MRCPHCATPNPGEPECRTCGSIVSVPPTDARLPNVEPTRVLTPAVTVALIPDLEASDRPVRDELEIVAIPRASSCRRCGAEAGSGRLCDRCGYALEPFSASDGSGRAPLRCLACGVPNRPDSDRCAACGEKVSA